MKQESNHALTVLKVQLLVNHIQAEIKEISYNFGRIWLNHMPEQNIKVTLMALGCAAMRTIRAPESEGKTVSRNCSQNFHGI